MKKYFLVLLLGVVGLFAQGAILDVNINFATDKGNGKSVGIVTISETPYGLLFTPNLQGLEPGIHGFHIHENPSCAPSEKDGKITPAGAAGGHFDPKKTGKHLGPYNDEGHLGDIPALYVTSGGDAIYPVLAPRIKKISEIKNRSLMIHAGGDNHSDNPTPLGGGGARTACGLIK